MSEERSVLDALDEAVIALAHMAAMARFPHFVATPVDSSHAEADAALLKKLRDALADTNDLKAKVVLLDDEDAALLARLRSKEVQTALAEAIRMMGPLTTQARWQETRAGLRSLLVKEIDG